MALAFVGLASQHGTLASQNCQRMKIVADADKFSCDSQGIEGQRTSKPGNVDWSTADVPAQPNGVHIGSSTRLASLGCPGTVGVGSKMQRPWVSAHRCSLTQTVAVLLEGRGVGWAGGAVRPRSNASVGIDIPLGSHCVHKGLWSLDCGIEGASRSPVSIEGASRSPVSHGIKK